MLRLKDTLEPSVTGVFCQSLVKLAALQPPAGFGRRGIVSHR